MLGYEPGEVDGIFDDNTAQAVEKLQATNNLEETGILTGNTTYALMDALRAKMKADDPQLLKAKELLVGTAEKQRKQQTNNVAVATVVFHGICDSFLWEELI